jgi:hypothetical protein
MPHKIVPLLEQHKLLMSGGVNYLFLRLYLMVIMNCKAVCVRDLFKLVMTIPCRVVIHMARMDDRKPFVCCYVDANVLYRPSDRLLSAKLVSNFANRGCRVVSETDPHGR